MANVRSLAEQEMSLLQANECGFPQGEQARKSRILHIDKLKGDLLSTGFSTRLWQVGNAGSQLFVLPAEDGSFL